MSKQICILAEKCGDNYIRDCNDTNSYAIIILYPLLMLLSIIDEMIYY